MGLSTYRPEDVTILLKDITGQIEPTPAQERERRIQSGVHYSEMLPLEYEPSRAYLDLYHQAMDLYAGLTAEAVAVAAEQILRDKGEDAVLVSLARAGTSVGVLLRRYLRKKYGIDAPHYTISIIRGRGIDRNAMDHILSRHRPETIQFVDGWTGKGAITRQLREAMGDYPGVDSGLAVLSDPAWLSARCGTHEDFLLPSSCLNAVASGLMSRTVLRSDLIGPEDFHGAVFYPHLRDKDLTYHFIDGVEAHFSFEDRQPPGETGSPSAAAEEVAELCRVFSIRDVNLIKPSIGEATRVLLRRLPWKVLVHSLRDDAHLKHLYQLAEEKGVELVEYPLRCYRACGLIRDLSDV